MPVVGQLHIAQLEEASIESAKEKLLQFPPESAFERIQLDRKANKKLLRKCPSSRTSTT